MDPLNNELSLPPLFTPVPLPGDAVPLRSAREAAETGDAMGTLFYARRPDRLEAALSLAPERRLTAALPVLYPLQLGLCDALGALLPPQYAVQFGWPDRIYLNGALCGAVAVDVPSEEPKADLPWMTLAVTLALMGSAEGPEPGLARERTTLHDEGAGDLSPGAILEAFARHFLSWLTRWEDRGLDAIWPAWEGRALGYDEDAAFPAKEGELVGRLAGFSREGNLRLKVAGQDVVLPLRQLLNRRGWALAGGA